VLSALRRHPLPMRTTFGHSLVLTYAVPPTVAAKLVPPSLRLDTLMDEAGTEHAFIAVAIVQTRRLRPAFLPPALGFTLTMTGYRVFTRFRTAEGRTLRGLRILRSDTGSRVLALGGNLLTHYGYALGDLDVSERDHELHVRVDSADGRADLLLRADLRSAPAPLPVGSPFDGPQQARRWAGPLRHTFESDPAGTVVITATRSGWEPRPVAVEVDRIGFFDSGPLADCTPVLAQAFHVHGVDYGWQRGVLHRAPQ
jgi:hypothetical protein